MRQYEKKKIFLEIVLILFLFGVVALARTILAGFVTTIFKIAIAIATNTYFVNLASALTAGSPKVKTHISRIKSFLYLDPHSNPDPNKEAIHVESRRCLVVGGLATPAPLTCDNRKYSELRLKCEATQVGRSCFSTSDIGVKLDQNFEVMRSFKHVTGRCRINFCFTMTFCSALALDGHRTTQLRA
ncbi:hypothetical protein EVAR_51615_1 [Eumeta japonica]|uniref:Uncharacterized protein n=1 Tax=Eumeta variegata TaxID=151549 RepID=A0A4C1YFY3_EUMVA|nr:hypothetical protein EVAR_51615_1 [Eumeta japonica]